MDEVRKKRLIEVIDDARELVRKRKKIKLSDMEAKTPQFAEEVLKQTKMLLLEEELRKRRAVKSIMANESRDAIEAEKKVLDAKELKERVTIFFFFD